MIPATATIRLAPGARFADIVPAALPAAAQAAAPAPAKRAFRAAAATMATAMPQAPPSRMPRSALPVPYLTTTGPQPGVALDTLVYEDVRDPAKKFYIPQYALATAASGDYTSVLRRDGRDWVLDLRLERVMAESVRAAAPRALPIDVVPRVTFTYAVYLGEDEEKTVQRSLEFQSVAVQRDGVLASLRVTAPADQDELYDALSVRGARGALTIWRQPPIAVPAQLATAELARLTEELRRMTLAPLVYLRAESHSGYLKADGSSMSPARCAFVLENLSGHDKLQSGDKVRLRTVGGATCLASVPGGPMRLVPVNDQDPGQQILLRKITGGSDRGPIYAKDGPLLLGDKMGILFFLCREQSYMAQNHWEWALEGADRDDEMWKVQQRDLAQRKAQLETLQRQFSTTEFDVPGTILPFDVPPRPFLVPQRTRPTFYQVTRGTAGVAGLTPVEVNGRVYYQDLAQRQRFYYLPDRFELQVPAGAAMPAVRIRATTDVDTYLVEYTAAPVVDAARLNADAAQRLLPEANRLASAPVTAVEFEPLLGDTAALSVAVPNGTAWAMQSRPATVSDLYHPFTDVLTLNADGLRQFWEALFTADTTPFRGAIDVTLGVPNAWARHQVPFVGRVRVDRDAFWTAAFDPSVPARFLRRIDVVAEPAMFNDAPSVVVSFEYGGVATLTSNAPRGSTDVGQPIGDYVLRKPDAGAYRYQLSGKSGANQPTPWLTGAGSTLRLTSWP